MLREYFLIFFGIITIVTTMADDDDLIIVGRDQWYARPPKLIEPMPNPVPYVIIHHSYEPSACYKMDDCIKALKWIQDLHQITNEWNDIGYQFLIGSDGRVYEGRGWSRIGAHAPKYNNISIGICLIGDWRYQLPPQQQLDTVQRLIDYGIGNNYISNNYKLLGHRQVRDTECPGERLFNEIKYWKHFVDEPDKEYHQNNNNNNNNVLSEFNKNVS